MTRSSQIPSPPSPERWSLSPSALERLFVILGGTPEDGAGEYQVVRAKLEKFFDRRGAPFPEQCADETLDRVARKAEGGLAIQHARGYVFGVARHVLQEAQRRRVREQQAHASWSVPGAPAEEPRDIEVKEACLRACIDELAPNDRETMEAYYSDQHQPMRLRRALAERLGIEYGALRMRVLRIRNSLAECLARRLDVRKGDGTR